MIEFKDEHNYGDFALTKFYDPSDEHGLGYIWRDLPDELTDYLDPFLGEKFGPDFNYFDPGKYGSYFISPSNLDRVIKKIETVIENNSVPDFKENIKRYLQLVTDAREQHKGVYITF